MVYELPQFQNQQQLCLAWITKRFMIMLMYRRPNGISFLPVCRQFSPLWARVQVILIQALCQDSISVRLGSLRAQPIYSVVQLPRLKKTKKFTTQHCTYIGPTPKQDLGHHMLAFMGQQNHKRGPFQDFSFLSSPGKF